MSYNRVSLSTSTWQPNETTSDITIPYSFSFSSVTVVQLSKPRSELSHTLQNRESNLDQETRCRIPRTCWARSRSWNATLFLACRFGSISFSASPDRIDLQHSLTVFPPFAILLLLLASLYILCFLADWSHSGKDRD